MEDNLNVLHDFNVTKSNTQKQWLAFILGYLQNKKPHSNSVLCKIKWYECESPGLINAVQEQ